jgi:hypothetical protein
MSALTIARVNFDTARTVYGIAVDKNYDKRVVDFLHNALLKAKAELKALDAPSPTQYFLEAFGLIEPKREPILPVSTPLSA